MLRTGLGEMLPCPLNPGQSCQMQDSEHFRGNCTGYKISVSLYFLIPMLVKVSSLKKNSFRLFCFVCIFSISESHNVTKVYLHCNFEKLILK